MLSIGKDLQPLRWNARDMTIIGASGAKQYLNGITTLANIVNSEVAIFILITLKQK